MDISDITRDAVDNIIKNRAKIIENYIQFWIAAQVPDAYTTPEWLADNIVLCEDRARGRMWIDFKDKK